MQSVEHLDLMQTSQHCMNIMQNTFSNLYSTTAVTAES